jgi:hypothetical protein
LRPGLQVWSLELVPARPAARRAIRDEASRAGKALPEFEVVVMGADDGRSRASPLDSMLQPTRVATRGLAYVAAERGTESAGRAVADALGDLGDSEILAAEQIPRDGHPPGEQVFHRRHAHGAGEAVEEREEAA